MFKWAYYFSTTTYGELKLKLQAVCLFASFVDTNFTEESHKKYFLSGSDALHNARQQTNCLTWYSNSRPHIKR